MKVSTILSETTKLVEVELDFNELTSIQIGALRAISDGRLDFENTSDSMDMVLYDLQEYNLLDSEFELTPTGQKAVDLAIKLGGSFERRQAAMAKDLKVDDKEDIDDVYDDDYGGDLGYDDEHMSIHQGNRYGSVHHHV